MDSKMIILWICPHVLADVIIFLLQALADFCAEGGTFIKSHISNQTVEMFEFYRSCNPRPRKDNVPEVLKLSEMNERLIEVQGMENKLGTSIEALFSSDKRATEVLIT